MILGLAAAGLTAACAMAPTEPAPTGPQAWRCDAEAARSLVGSHIGAVTFR